MANVVCLYGLLLFMFFPQSQRPFLYLQKSYWSDKNQQIRLCSGYSLCTLVSHSQVWPPHTHAIHTGKILRQQTVVPCAAIDAETRDCDSILEPTHARAFLSCLRQVRSFSIPVSHCARFCSLGAKRGFRYLQRDGPLLTTRMSSRQLL